MFPCHCLQIWRVRECDELYQQLRPSFSQLPPDFQSSVHYHLGIHAGHPPMKLLRALRAAAHAAGGTQYCVPCSGKCSCCKHTAQSTASRLQLMKQVAQRTFKVLRVLRYAVVVVVEGASRHVSASLCCVMRGSCVFGSRVHRRYASQQQMQLQQAY
jgi:hypothetical protein